MIVKTRSVTILLKTLSSYIIGIHSAGRSGYGSGMIKKAGLVLNAPHSWRESYKRDNVKSLIYRNPFRFFYILSYQFFFAFIPKQVNVLLIF